jgi:hypothetical protein
VSSAGISAGLDVSTNSDYEAESFNGDATDDEGGA